MSWLSTMIPLYCWLSPKLMRLWMDWVTVDTADFAPAALDRVAATDYDAIISDIRMPGMSGLELLAAIRARRPTTPILLITAYSEREFVMQALRAGAYDFIQKPLDSEYFVASLSRAIQMRHLSRQVEAQQDALARHAAELETTVAERTRDLRAALAAQDALLAERDRALVEAEAAKNRLLFLAEASDLLATSLDYDTTLALVTRLAVPYLADYCSLDVVEAGGSLRYVMAAHVDPSKEHLVAELRRRFPPEANPDYPVWDAPRTGRPLLYPDVSTTMVATSVRTAEVEGRSARWTPVRAWSCLSRPMTARSGCLLLSPPPPAAPTRPMISPWPKTSPAAPPWPWIMPGSTRKPSKPCSCAITSVDCLARAKNAHDLRTRLGAVAPAARRAGRPRGPPRCAHAANSHPANSALASPGGLAARSRASRPASLALSTRWSICTACSTACWTR